ncbi:MAG: hypothetical protein JRE29_14225 [Deltaproteobacteria bacterium]|nr:hypothetical protein [Deltaproteobacteria bacterium]
MISVVNGERFWLKDDQEAKLKNTKFTIKNKGVMKTIFRDPFDEFYDIFLQLAFQSEEELVELSLSSTGAEEDKRSCKWNGFHIEIFSADCYHDGPVSIEVFKPTKRLRPLHSRSV